MKPLTTPKTSPQTLLEDSAQLCAEPIRFYMRQNPGIFLCGSVALVLCNTLDVSTTFAVKYGIDAVMQGNTHLLTTSILAYIALMSGVVVFRFSWRVFFGRFHHAVAEDLRNRIFGKLTSLGPSFFQKSPVGTLMSLMINDVNAFRMGIGPGLLTLIDAFSLIALLLPIMCWFSWSWTWKTMIFLPFVPFFMRKMEFLIHERFRAEQDRLAESSARTQEIISGVRVIKSFAQEDHQLADYNQYSRRYQLAGNRVAQVDSSFSPVMRAAGAMGSVALIYWGMPDIIQGRATLGTLVAFLDLVRRVVWPMSAIGIGMSLVEQGRASFDRIRDLFLTETDIPDNGTKDIGEFNSIELRGLTFRYAGSEVDALSNINLKIERGETIGIVGSVGAGKTTLLQVITRLFPTEPGRVLINGVDVAEYRRASISKAISYVTQDVFLFSDTISENVALGLPVHPGMPSVTEALQLVNIDREVEEIPDRYETYLGERGVNLSGGQKQRLTIARATIRSSQVVMLDDSLSAVDGKTEKMITDAFRSSNEAEKADRKTVILVSHRLATLMHADRIVVMNQGRIEAVDSHQNLLRSCETYQRLYELQMSEDENSSTDELDNTKSGVFV